MTVDSQGFNLFMLLIVIIIAYRSLLRGSDFVSSFTTQDHIPNQCNFHPAGITMDDNDLLYVSSDSEYICTSWFTILTENTFPTF